MNLVLRQHQLDGAIDTGLRHVNVSRRLTGLTADDSATVITVNVDVSTVEAGYFFLRSVAEQIQEQSVEPSAAIYQSIRAFKSLLLGSSMGSTGNELGLVGEILLLRALVDRGIATFDQAVEAWLGPHKEEHDFAFGAGDIEVKTTAKESRRHLISSITQLVATEGKALALASVQLTRTSEAGETLKEIINELRASLGSDEALRTLQSRLQLAGVVPENEHTYTTRWTPRNPIEFYKVDGKFPRLSTDDFAPMHDRIDSVQYVIRTDGYPTLTDDELRALIIGTNLITDAEEM
ncbi:PD-(D/E)XK motif protein [Corynebacterium hansenii]|uniref:PD-(D/E)XK motif protein n=1 Tax=Corynebacterium hansenii TaxID=394964 RepID=A0ABV7ZQ60_9CORY|nr:PD-(D/E)XK motif protein [Corynebacterium hansenii]WJY99832.1 hypothetical protein CHAN_06065 [Corynebacterium hansenii]